jgi:2-octaprenyl-6-methoxyphenol hydroxylase
MADASLNSDIVIAGAGIAGAGFALSVKRSVGNLFSVTLCDTGLTRELAACLNPGPRSSMRAIAVAPDSKQTLEDLGVWADIAASAQPIHTMAITDSRRDALPNPVFLTFDGEARPDGVLAHMVFIEDLRRALLRACHSAGVRFEPVGVDQFRDERHALTLALSDGRSIRTRLLAAADGGRSRLRHAARIQCFDRAYPQSAIVATLHHSESHEGRAVQHFLPAGPVALLPMRAADGSPRRTSIVWTEATREAERLARLPEAEFLAALQDRVGRELGSLSLEDQPSAYPLHVALARRLIAPRLALLGDAAHVVHPLAGQGLNLGLRDATALAARVTEVGVLGLDPGSTDTLKAYERDRHFDAATMAATTDMLNRLFSNDILPIRLMRDIGLGLVDRAPRLKRRFIDGAAGLPTNAPLDRDDELDAPVLVPLDLDRR